MLVVAYAVDRVVENRFRGVDRSFFRAQRQHNQHGVGVAGADRWATDDANEVGRRVGTAPAISLQERPTNDGWWCSLRALFEQ